MSQHFNTVLEHLKSVSLRKGRSTPEPDETNNSLASSSADVETTAKEKSGSCNFFKFQSALLPSLTSSIIPMSTGSTTAPTSMDESDKCVQPDKDEIEEDEFVVNGRSGSKNSKNKSTNNIPTNQAVNSSSSSSSNNSCNPSICSKCSNKIDTFDTQIIRKRASICVPNGDYRIRNNNISPLRASNTKSKVVATTSTSSEICAVVGSSTVVVSKTASTSGSPKKSDRSRAGSLINTDEEGRPILVRKPIKVKNVSSGAETYDTLHCKGREVSRFYMLFFFFLRKLTWDYEIGNCF